MLTHDPCVCVQSAEKNCANTDPAKTESQDSGVCVNSHTGYNTLLLLATSLEVVLVCVQTESVYTQSVGTVLANLHGGFDV